MWCIPFLVVICSGVAAFSEDIERLPGTQVATTPLLREIVRSFEGLQAPEDLKSLRFIMMYNLEQRKYSRRKRGNEQRIRWRRSASQIFQEGYVYQGKCDADLVIAFLGLCRALGAEGRFVKVWRGDSIYSLAEVQLDTVWYIYDVVSSTAEPIAGSIDAQTGFEGWKLWRKGRDSWDIGLKGYRDKQKMCDVLDCSIEISK